MNLIIDVGNTLVKLALFQGDVMVEKKEFPKSKIYSEVKKIVKAKHPKQAIISSVGKLTESIMAKLAALIPVLIVDASIKLPYNNKYKTPETIGSDRLALAAAAAVQYSNTNVLVIDTGSCITYDFMDKNANYLGGGISPGLNMRYRALNTFTAKLPLLSPTPPETLFGDTTLSSIHSGTFGGLLRELDGIISDYKKNYTDLTVILTGGDAKLLANQLKNSIFANSNFLLEGLNSLLEFNTK